MKHFSYRIVSIFVFVTKTISLFLGGKPPALDVRQERGDRHVRVHRASRQLPLQDDLGQPLALLRTSLKNSQWWSGHGCHSTNNNGKTFAISFWLAWRHSCTSHINPNSSSVFSNHIWVYGTLTKLCRYLTEPQDGLKSCSWRHFRHQFNSRHLVGKCGLICSIF